MFSGVGVISISTITSALSEAESVDSPKMAEGVEDKVVGVVLIAMVGILVGMEVINFLVGVGVINFVGVGVGVGVLVDVGVLVGVFVGVVVEVGVSVGVSVTMMVGSEVGVGSAIFRVREFESPAGELAPPVYRLSLTKYSPGPL